MHKLFKKVKRLIKILNEAFIWIRHYFVKKNPNIWVFGAIRGTRYMDNAKYLFEYINEHTDIKAIWISKNPDVVRMVKEKGYHSFLETSKEAKHYISRAKVVVITHRGNRAKADVPMHLLSKETKIIQLWHGIPLKKIAYDDKVFSFKHDEESLKWKVQMFIKKTFLPFLNYVNKPSLILALSKETQEIFSKAFRTPKEKVVITGYPRNDILLQNAAKHIEKGKTKKVIYMPTFRGSVNSDFDLFTQYNFDVEKMDTFLSQQHMQLHIKLHPFNQPSETLMTQLKASTNIIFLEHDAIYEIIHEYDMLITDYSSIYFDYLLLDRPIIFTPFDKESYIKQDREFYFDYDEVTPGPQALNWNEVMQNINLFNKTPHRYKEERERTKNRFHFYQDDKSTQRVFEAILDIADK